MLTKATWPLFTLSKKKSKINTNPDYQRPSVWTKAQKQMLIDSILRDFDIPKIYLHKTSDDTFDVMMVNRESELSGHSMTTSLHFRRMRNR